MVKLVRSTTTRTPGGKVTHQFSELGPGGTPLTFANEIAAEGHAQVLRSQSPQQDVDPLVRVRYVIEPA